MVAHAGFIIAAYAVTAVVLAGMLAAILLDHRAQNRLLTKLSERLRQQGGPPSAATAPRRDHDDEP